MNRAEIFKNYKHTFLYSKYWYERSDNIFYDLSQTLNADGFYLTPNEKGSIAELMLGIIEKLDKIDIRFVLALDPYSSHRCGYYHEDTPFLFKAEQDKNKYYYNEALVRISLSFMASEECKGLLVGKPDKKVLPLSENSRKKKVKSK